MVPVRKYIYSIIFIAVVILNVILLLQNNHLKKQAKNTVYEYGSHLLDIGGVTVDLRGAYTYPGFGSYFVPRDAQGRPLRAPLTLAIFLSAETTCPASLGETEVYRRLIPALRDRGQAVVAVTPAKDSANTAAFLNREKLDIPLVVWHVDTSQGALSLEQMGISPRFMPFKIIYDSTLTAIYMRGADNTPESQADFEKAMLWLSDLIANQTGEVMSMK
jgi:hypothetical protein